MLHLALWSKLGLVAYTLPGVHNVLLTHLELPHRARWQLAQPVGVTVKPDDSPAARATAVLWANNPTDLAVADEHGNFYVVCAGVKITRDSYEVLPCNQTAVIYRSPGARVVAMQWLALEKSHIVNKPAVCELHFVYGAQQQQPAALTHPIALKQACVLLRDDGTLSLHYQGEHRIHYHCALAQLKPCAHAAVGFATVNDARCIVACVHDAHSRRLCVYAVAVDWGHLPEAAHQQKTDVHHQTPPAQQRPVALHATLLHEMALLPAVLADGDLLLKLRFKSVHIVGRDVLVAYALGPRTLVQRFALHNEAPSAGALFAQLAHGAPQGGLYTLRIVDQVTLPKSLRSVHHGTELVFVYDDGLLDVYYDWERRPRLERPTQLVTLLDCFRLPPLQNVYALSPNLAAAVCGEPGQPLQLRFSEPTSHPALWGVCIAYIHANACYGSVCSDDLVALTLRLCAHTNADELIEQIVCEAQRALNFQPHSFGRDAVDRLLSNTPLQKLMSLQMSLGEAHLQPAMGTVAWVLLLLRSTSFGTMLSLSTIYRQLSKKKRADDTLQESTARAECIMSMVGNIQWLIDFIAYINQELIQLCMNGASPLALRVTVQTSIALPILLAKLPRLFLAYALSSITKTQEILKKLHNDLNENNKMLPPMREALSRAFLIFGNAPFSLLVFDSFLRETDLFVSSEIASIADDDAKKLKVEQSLCCHGRIPDELLPLAGSLIERHNASVSRDPKYLTLYFHDTMWLDISVASRSAHVEPPSGHLPTTPRFHLSKTECIDVLRKLVIDAGPTLKPNPKLRKCVRCRLVSLLSDPFLFDTATSLWTLHFQRTCICGSSWVTT